MSQSTPTKARYVVTAFAVTLALITYIDRVGIAVAAPFISKDLGLSTIQMGWALSAFGWAYAIFEIPGGWLGDRIGPRRVLMRIVIWWSVFTAATGWVWNASSLVVTRALFGAGEAGAFPNLTRVFTTWLPVRERERAQAILWLATRVSGAFTPILVASLIAAFSWQRTFEIFGVIGVVWAILFYRWYRDAPGEHPKVNRAELALLPPPHETAIASTGVPWGLIFSTQAVWLLSIQYMCLAYGWWFYINWLPTYLRQARGTSLRMGALLAGLPLLLGGLGCLVSAWLVPKLRRRFGSVAIARRIIAVTGFVGASVCIFIFTGIEDPVQAMFVLGMAGFFNDFVMPAAWASTMDIGGRYSGTVSGAMNMMGSIAGASSVTVVGYLLAWTSGNWNLTFYISAAIYLVGAVCWLFLDSHTPLEHTTTAAERAA
jgi:ACS family glucarate transporter-like MFS transporter